ncbi:galactose mutarotase [Fodinisporobacter ferrooxydans]|uniref:Aldose 1-epimerase n=1 Tax=Fodinisporobacter ferrooxydans TaxID=2901836 RepID=A0ABY4CJF7_9BACL|nr:galactose mutarotase [Alicyclobacillaceae bacterium MYW30-H2]
MKVEQKPFGTLDGQRIQAYTIRNDHHLEITCLNYGCVITKILTPDRTGNFENIVLGFADIESYETESPYFGAVIGRVAGRIKDGQFELDGKSYTVTKNENGNHLHGGRKGFHRVVWDAAVIDKGGDETGVRFAYTSPNGEEGYPGTVMLTVSYTLNNNNEFLIHYQAQSYQTTLLNMTNHSYFNLSGNLQRDVLQHRLKIDSDKFLELNEQLLPTGKLLDVSGTVFDLRSGRQIQEGVCSDHPQIELAGRGYDHPFLLNKNHDREIVLWEEESGRTLTIETDAVGVVLYTGNQLSETMDVHGVKSKKYLGLCLETQGLPDAIHHSNFPSFVLEKDETFSSRTKYTFGIA